VLDAGGDDVTASAGLQHLGRPAEGQVVRLGTAAREDHLARLGRDQLRHCGARLVQHGLGALAEVMNTRRIAEIFCKRARDRVPDRGVHRGCRVVVEIRSHGYWEIWKLGNLEILLSKFSHFHISKLYHGR
jgi:hypothetical protein